MNEIDSLDIQLNKETPGIRGGCQNIFVTEGIPGYYTILITTNKPQNHNFYTCRKLIVKII